MNYKQGVLLLQKFADTLVSTNKHTCEYMFVSIKYMLTLSYKHKRHAKKILSTIAPNVINSSSHKIRTTCWISSLSYEIEL